MKYVACLFFLLAAGLADSKHAPLSPALTSAKTCFIDNQSGDHSETDAAFNEIQKLKLCTVVTEREKADITLRLIDSANGNPKQQSTDSDGKFGFTTLEVRTLNGDDILWSNTLRWSTNAGFGLVPIGKSAVARLMDDLAKALHP